MSEIINIILDSATTLKEILKRDGYFLNNIHWL